MPEEVWVRRCGEELDAYTRAIVRLIVTDDHKTRFEHECIVHDDAHSCALQSQMEHASREIHELLEKAQSDLAKCLGRIAKE
jgi:hypothetical protein